MTEMTDTSEVQVSWKHEVLEEFRRWLETLPEEPPAPGAEAGAAAAEPLPGADLHGLLVELAALRQELRLQNREQGRAARDLERAAEEYAEAKELFRTAAGDRQQLAEQLAADAVRRTLVPLLDVRDALVRGHAAAVRVAGRRGLFARPPRGIQEVGAGYEMAIERFDRALARSDVRRVAAVGEPFDPRTMVAVEVREEPEEEEGIVLAEARSGFLRGGEVLRAAEVVVNRRPRGEEA